jgi:ankyrin repeat protein
MNSHRHDSRASLQTLGISIDSDESAISKAYHDLSQLHHPDKPGDMQLLLTNGADPNAWNDAGATALMWAVDDLEKTKLLVRHRADVNARSFDGRTPLLIAAAIHGNSSVV